MLYNIGQSHSMLTRWWLKILPGKISDQVLFFLLSQVEKICEITQANTKSHNS